MKRIGFFGGCFNPPTNIHIKIANDLIKQNRIDKVVFVPVNDYYKKEKLIEAKHRYNMIKIAIENNFGLEVDDIELKENRMLYAKDAFKLINKKYDSNDEIYFIMGSDNFKNMNKWKEYDKIKDKYKYIVVDRDKNEISSTDIRNMILKKEIDVLNYLPVKVYEYIKENSLYKL